jgi:hypothetical protein
MTDAKQIYDKPMKRRSVYLPDHLVEHAKDIGDGEMAKGIRQVLEASLEDEDHVNEKGT